MTDSRKSKVYVIQTEGGGPFKVGVALDPKTRLSDLQVANPSKLQLVAAVDGDESLEKEIHAALSEYRIRGEWFIPYHAAKDKLCEMTGLKMSLLRTVGKKSVGAVCSSCHRYIYEADHPDNGIVVLRASNAVIFAKNALMAAEAEWAGDLAESVRSIDIWQEQMQTLSRNLVDQRAALAARVLDFFDHEGLTKAWEAAREASSELRQLHANEQAEIEAMRRRALEGAGVDPDASSWRPTPIQTAGGSGHHIHPERPEVPTDYTKSACGKCGELFKPGAQFAKHYRDCASRPSDQQGESE